MATRIRSFARPVLLVVVLLATGQMQSAPAAPAANNPSEPIAQEVRLRKLHLVRPDLIPYPIAFEVNC